MECTIDGTLLNRAHKAVFTRHLEISTVIALFPGHWMVTCGSIAVFGKTDYDGPEISLRPEAMYPTWPTFPKGPVTLTEDGFRWDNGTQRFPMTKRRKMSAGKTYNGLLPRKILGSLSKADIRRQIKEVPTLMVEGTYQQRIPLYGHDFDGPLLTSVLPLLPSQGHMYASRNPDAFWFEGSDTEVVVCRLLPPEQPA